MLRFLVPLLLTLSSVTSLHNRPYYARTSPTAASESQIKFAIENKYDDTGPGAKKQEFAYKTYKTLEDALVAYFDDPDTKLPEYEKTKAVHKLLSALSRPVSPSSVNKPPSYNAYQKPQMHSQNLNSLSMPGKNVFYHNVRKPAVSLPAIMGNNVLKSIPDNKIEPFKFKKVHTMKGSPISLAHYTRDRDIKATFDQFDPYPKYSFSYGVHDKSTGDMKQAAETWNGGAVHGFYSYRDPNGQQRAVRYQADDVKGFRATIKTLGQGFDK